MNPKKLMDIRFYKDQDFDMEKGGWSLLPDHKNCERFVLKLYETDFSTPGYDHVYIYLTDKLKHGEIQFNFGGTSVQNLHAGVKFTELLKEPFQREDFYINLIADALYFLAVRDGLEKSFITDVKNLVLTQKEKLEILCASKSTKSHIIRLFMLVENTPKLFVEVTNLSTGESIQQKIIDLKDTRDAFKLTSKISVTKGTIRVIPRKSTSSDWIFSNHFQSIDSAGFLGEDGKSIEIKGMI